MIPQILRFSFFSARPSVNQPDTPSMGKIGSLIHKNTSSQSPILYQQVSSGLLPGDGFRICPKCPVFLSLRLHFTKQMDLLYHLHLADNPYFFNLSSLPPSASCSKCYPSSFVGSPASLAVGKKEDPDTPDNISNKDPFGFLSFLGYLSMAAIELKQQC